MSPVSDQRPGQNATPQSGTFRQTIDRYFVVFCIATASVSVAILVVLLVAILVQGIPNLSWRFLTSPPSPETTEAGISPALFGTIWVCSACTFHVADWSGNRNSVGGVPAGIPCGPSLTCVCSIEYHKSGRCPIGCVWDHRLNGVRQHVWIARIYVRSNL